MICKPIIFFFANTCLIFSLPFKGPLFIPCKEQTSLATESYSQVGSFDVNPRHSAKLRSNMSLLKKTFEIIQSLKGLELTCSHRHRATYILKG